MLTILDNHDAASATRLADLTHALFVHGFPTTEVVPDIDGRRITYLKGKPAMLKQWIGGRVLDPLPDDLLAAAGIALAELHGMPIDLPGLPVGTRRLSPDQETWIDDFPDRAFAEWLTSGLHRVRRHDGPRPAAVTHGDLFADNLIVRPDHTLAAIDWETASLDDPLLDVGMAIVGLAREGHKLAPERATRLVSGYTETRSLTSDELAALPLMAEHAALIIAFHSYHRHNVRFPNPDTANRYRAMIDFVDSLVGFELAT